MEHTKAFGEVLLAERLFTGGFRVYKPDRAFLGWT
jgi:hypothetical protein